MIPVGYSINGLEKFNSDQIGTVNNSAAMAEEVVSNFYKMSASQWLRRKYDFKTLDDLYTNEIVHGAFAQIVRYEGKRKDTILGSSTYDFYKICLQDHAILSALRETPGMELFPFTLYILTHELIHIIRFSQFLQNFNASPKEKLVEEKRVHENTFKILKPLRVAGLPEVLRYYDRWRIPVEVQ